MHEFRDTIAINTDTLSLPSEAVSVNGKWLDLEIDGFRTISVEGREGLSAEVETTPLRTNGSLYRYKRYPERTIKVNFQILAENAEDYREKWNAIGKYLDCEQVELVFADEPDKYYIATPTVIDPPEAGKKNSTASVTFICPDPLKYTLGEKEETLEGSENPLITTFDYKGTAPVRPVFDITFDGQDDEGDALYVEIEEQRTGKRLYFGIDTNEQWEGTTVNLETDVAGMTVANGWVQGRVDSVEHLGETLYNAIGSGANRTVGTWNAPSTYQAISGQRQILRHNAPVGEYADSWKGASFSKSLSTPYPYNYRNVFRLRFPIGANTAGHRILMYRILSTNDVEIFRLTLEKMSSTVTAGTIRMMLFGQTVYEKEMFAPAEPVDRYEFQISKTGTSFVLDVFKETQVLISRYTENISQIETSLTLGVLTPTQAEERPGTVEFGSYIKAGGPTGEDPNAYGIEGQSNPVAFSFKGSETNAEHYFHTGDHLVIDCNDGSVTLNNTDATEYGSIQNDWGAFIIRPGENTFHANYSDGMTYEPPVVKAKYKEAYY